MSNLDPDYLALEPIPKLLNVQGGQKGKINFVVLSTLSFKGVSNRLSEVIKNITITIYLAYYLVTIIVLSIQLPYYLFSTKGIGAIAM